MPRTFEETLADIIRPEVEGLGCRLWGLTSPTKGSRRVVRIYIEGDDGSATIDQCAKVSRQVGLLLEVEDVIPSAYVLEVSSPGMDRRFFSTGQMKDYLGKKMTAQTYEAVDGRKKFAGTLTEIGDDSFILDVDGQPARLDWTSVKEVRLEPEF